MAIETLVVMLVVGSALFFVGRRAWRAVQSTRGAKGAGCDAGCGCDTPAPSQPRDWGTS